MLDVLARVSSVLLALTFGWAGTVKLLALGRWRTAVAHYDLPPLLERAAFGVTPLLEISAAVLLVAGQLRVGAALVLALVAAFCLLLVRARNRHGERVPCGCFGRDEDQDVGLLLIRNGLLAALAALLLAASSEVDGDALPRSGEILPAALVVVGLATALWMIRRAFSSLGTREGR